MNEVETEIGDKLEMKLQSVNGFHALKTVPALDDLSPDCWQASGEIGIGLELECSSGVYFVFVVRILEAEMTSSVVTG
jgi:hypothetical protein